MLENKFTQKDQELYVSALNFIATEAKFGSDKGVDVKYCIEFYKHFHFLQALVSKISANIAEQPKIYNPKEESKPEPEAKPARGRAKKGS